jgi:hypothetical protein
MEGGLDDHKMCKKIDKSNNKISPPLANSSAMPDIAHGRHLLIGRQI